MKDLRQKIISAFEEVAKMRNSNIMPLFNEVVLLESGLDSLGFAILVAKLEEDLGYDPFVLADLPIYPRTFGDFISLYERFLPK
jgi:acyl carrier protein